MKQAFLTKTPIGIFALTESGEIIFYKLFERIPAKAAHQFREKIPGSFLSELGSYTILDGSRVGRKKIRELAINLGFSSSDWELTAFLSEFSSIISRERIRLSASRDRLVVQASNALEDMIKIQNLFLERLREWYGLHYPELKMNAKDLAEKISNFGNREKFPGFSDSTGIQLDEEDENALKSQAGMILTVMNQRKNLEQYIKSAVRGIAPNFSSLIDELLAARMLASAGSLEKMSKMSSSSIQLMGAEKALFRHLRGGGKSPKFGIIFLSSHIQNAPEAQRGKAARVLAAKIMQAVRIDFYSGRDESLRLKQELADEMKVMK